MPEDKLPIPQFAAKIKQKYPQYKNINDTLLVQKMVEKYPEYKESVDLSGIGEPEKKKEPSYNTSKIGGAVGSSASPSVTATQPIQPTLKTKLQETIEKNKSAQTKAVTDYAYSLKTPQEKQLAQETIENTAAKSYREGDKRLMQIVDAGFTDPVSAAKQQAAGETDPQKILRDFMAVKSFTDLTSGHDAKELLAANMATGETAEILKAKEKKYDAVVQPFRELQFMYGDQVADNPENDINYKDKIYSAAVQAYANKNPEFAAQIKAAGIDPKDWTTIKGKFDSGTLGHKMYDVLNDPDFAEYVQKENQSLYNAMQKVSDDLLTDNVEFGINTVANEISRDRQSSGFNNPIVEFDDINFRKETDLVAERLYRDDPVKMKIYQDYIQQDPDKYIDTPSLIEGIASGAKGVYKGIGNTFTEPFRSVPESIKRSWEKESSYVSADQKGITKFMNDTGHVLGLVGAIGGVGNVMGAGGTGFYSSKAVPALSGGVLPFMGDMLEEGRKKYPGSPVKAWTSALTNTAMYAALSQQLFPAKNIQKALGEVKPEINKITERLASGEITREAARAEANTAFKKAYDFVAGTVKGSAKISAELSAITAFNRGLDKIMMDEQTFEKFHPQGEVGDTFKSMFLSNLVLAGFGKYGQQKKDNRLARETYYELASNPKLYEREINNLSVDKSFGTINELKENLYYISKLKQQLESFDMSPEAKKEYIYQSLIEKNANDIAATIDEPLLKKEQIEIAQKAQNIKQGIIDGKFKEPEPFVDGAKISQDRDLMDKEPELTSAEMKAVKIAALEPLPGMYQEMLDSNPAAVIKEIADQAQGVSEDGKPLEGGSRKQDLLNSGVSQKFIDAAIEAYPAPSQSVSVQMPEEVSKPQTTEIKPAETQSSEVLNNLSKSDRETGTIALFESGLSIEEGEQLVEEIKNGNVTVNNLHTRLNVPINTLFFAKKLLTEGKLADALGKAIEIKKSQKETVIDIEEQNKKSITINEKFINELKQKRDSEDFKYIIVEESDVLGNRKKVKRLKTKQELEESTKKINDAINKAEKENEKLKLQLKEQPKPAEPIEEDMTAFVKVTRPELGFEELPTDILDNMDSKTMAVQGKRLEGLNKNLGKLKELFECIWS